MSGRGPAAGDQHSRERDQRRRHDDVVTKIEPDEELRGPELPPMDEECWHPRTLAWWETWRRSPQSQRFVATDWDFLIDTALMHHTMWSKARWEFAAELRLRAAKFGATVEDRQRLKLDITSDASAPTRPMKRSTASTRRDRVLKAVSE